MWEKNKQEACRCFFNNQTELYYKLKTSNVITKRKKISKSHLTQPPLSALSSSSPPHIYIAMKNDCTIIIILWQSVRTMSKMGGQKWTRKRKPGF